MSEAEAVARLIGDAERKPFLIEHAERTFIVLPGQQGAWTHVEVTSPYNLKPRAERVVAAPAFGDRGSFIDYVNRFKSHETLLWVEPNEATFAATFDYHAPGVADVEPTAGFMSHGATFGLREHETYKRWRAATAEWMDQDEFAEFLEENHVDVRVPDGTALLELAADLDAKKSVQWKSQIRRDSTTRVFEYDEQVTTTQRSKGEVKVPRQLELAVPFFEGEAAISSTLLLRYRLASGTIGFKLDWYRHDYAKRAVIDLAAADIFEKTGLRPLVGKPGASLR